MASSAAAASAATALRSAKRPRLDASDLAASPLASAAAFPRSSDVELAASTAVLPPLPASIWVSISLHAVAIGAGPVCQLARVSRALRRAVARPPPSRDAAAAIYALLLPAISDIIAPHLHPREALLQPPRIRLPEDLALALDRSAARLWNSLSNSSTPWFPRAAADSPVMLTVAEKTEPSAAAVSLDTSYLPATPLEPSSVSPSTDNLDGAPHSPSTASDAACRVTVAVPAIAATSAAAPPTAYPSPRPPAAPLIWKLPTPPSSLVASDFAASARAHPGCPPALVAFRRAISLLATRDGLSLLLLLADVRRDLPADLAVGVFASMADDEPLAAALLDALEPAGTVRLRPAFDFSPAPTGPDLERLQAYCPPAAPAALVDAVVRALRENGFEAVIDYERDTLDLAALVPLVHLLEPARPPVL
ncbi:hypothetical protein HK405_005669 [Cladochytrium tenue]|nr:hypothetical protein HK405_005669 [Cladochytrium tenue]